MHCEMHCFQMKLSVIVAVLGAAQAAVGDDPGGVTESRQAVPEANF